MAYTYETRFDILSEHMDWLEVGAALERGLGYMRTLLPSEAGFITARAMYSLEHDDKTHVVFQSMWDRWEDLEAHTKTYLDERRLLVEEFQPHLDIEEITTHFYEEVA